MRALRMLQVQNSLGIPSLGAFEYIRHELLIESEIDPI
jgi:hypothetical protein